MIQSSLICIYFQLCDSHYHKNYFDVKFILTCKIFLFSSKHVINSSSDLKMLFTSLIYKLCVMICFPLHNRLKLCVSIPRYLMAIVINTQL